MTTTTHLALPLIAAGQAQKHVTHNEALLAIDALLHCAVKDKDLAAPPGAPAEGDRYIVAAAPSGAWAGKAGQVAAWQDGVWRFYAPKAGWIAFVFDEMQLYHFDGATWAQGVQAITNLQNLTSLGVGTTADATNPFSTKLNNVLHAAKTVAEGGSGDIKVKLSKESAAKTASYLFQTNFSGRAEIGLVGDDDLAIKVSADGASWREALRVDRASGVVSFPRGTSWSREKLSAARTYYVRTTGSDAADGLSAGSAFATIQKAIDTAAGLDLSIHDVTIDVGAGTYSAALTLKTLVGAGRGIVQGAGATTIVSTASADCFKAQGILGRWKLANMKLQTTTSGHGISLNAFGCEVAYAGLDFGAVAGSHVYVQAGLAIAEGACTISGGAGRHLQTLGAGAQIDAGGGVHTLSGSPAFSSAFVDARRCSNIRALTTAFSGAAGAGTAKFYVDMNAVIFAADAGEAGLPGDTAGTKATGGQYD